MGISVNEVYAKPSQGKVKLNEHREKARILNSLYQELAKLAVGWAVGFEP